MLEIQKYLAARSQLGAKNRLKVWSAMQGLNLAPHSNDPLVILNYDQIDSPKSGPARLCRSLVLNTLDNSLVSRSFERFFNLGEMLDEADKFDWSNFSCLEKLDGSLICIHYFNDKWYLRTRGSWADSKIEFQDFTWFEAVCKAIDCVPEDFQKECNRLLDKKLTYVCEFCSPWNKVVRQYKEPYLYLLTCFDGEKELALDELQFCEFFWEPRRYQFSSLEDIKKYIQEQESTDKTWEGVVVRDVNNQRWKIKSSTYVSLHQMRGEGDNMFNPKYLIPWILAGDTSELLTYFPEVSSKLSQLTSLLDEEFDNLARLWIKTWKIEDQKEFALAIVGKSKYSSMLFNLRKQLGKNQTLSDLQKFWRGSANTLIKSLKS